MEPNRLRDEATPNTIGPTEPPPEQLDWRGRPRNPLGLWYPGNSVMGYPRPPEERRPPARPAEEPHAPLASTSSDDLPGAKHWNVLLGGLTLAISVAGLGVVAIMTAASDLQADPGKTEVSALRTIFGWLLLGLAVILALPVLRAGGAGRRARYSMGLVSLGFGGSFLLFGPPAMVLAAPFLVSAYLLLRSV